MCLRKKKLERKSLDPKLCQSTFCGWRKKLRQKLFPIRFLSVSQYLTHNRIIEFVPKHPKTPTLLLNSHIPKICENRFINFSSFLLIKGWSRYWNSSEFFYDRDFLCRLAQVFCYYVGSWGENCRVLRGF